MVWFLIERILFHFSHFFYNKILLRHIQEKPSEEVLMKSFIFWHQIELFWIVEIHCKLWANSKSFNLSQTFLVISISFSKLVEHFTFKNWKLALNSQVNKTNKNKKFGIKDKTKQSLKTLLNIKNKITFVGFI